MESMKGATIARGLEFTKEQVLALYRDAGWTSYTRDPESLWKAIAASLASFSILESGELVAYARLLGDGIHTVLVQDLIVRSDRQGRGYGSALLRAVLEDYAGVRQILLICDPDDGLRSFYAKNGLTELKDGEGACFARLR